MSVLSAPEPLEFSSRQDALAKLRPGVDGVILYASALRATFLPQVWDELPDPEQFLNHLMRKAGLEPSYWSATIKLERYSVAAFTEGD